MLSQPTAQALAAERPDGRPANLEGGGQPAGGAPAGPPDLFVTTDRGPAPRFSIGETVVVQAQPAGDGYLYCYYADSRGAVSRIFPNRFQPDAFVPASRQVEIPPGYQK